MYSSDDNDYVSLLAHLQIKPEKKKPVGRRRKRLTKNCYDGPKQGSPATKTDVIDLLSCPVCLEMFKPPVKLCPDGHSFCEKCVTDKTECPECHQTMDSSNMRNYTVEKIIERINKVKQPVEKDVATAAAPEAIRLQNVKFRCPGHVRGIWQCLWKGTNSEMMAHFTDAHTEHVVDPSFTYTIETDFKNSKKDLKLIKWEDGLIPIYVIHYVDVKQGKLYWLCRVPEMVHLYRCRLNYVDTVTGKKANLVTRVVDMKGHDNSKNGCGLAIPFTYVKNKFTMTVTITSTIPLIGKDKDEEK